MKKEEVRGSEGMQVQQERDVGRVGLAHLPLSVRRWLRSEGPI
jgi:hypothetical protein